MAFFIIFAVLLLAVIVIFSFPQFSPIPYYPSNMQDKPLILKALALVNNQTVIDLGAGDGVVVYEAARTALFKHLNTRFVALEINPVLILILHIRRLFHPNRKNIRIIWGDMFKINYQSLVVGGGSEKVTFYLYISPWLIEKALSRTCKALPHAVYVSYFYPVKSMGKKEKILKGVHNVYIYN